MNVMMRLVWILLKRFMRLVTMKISVSNHIPSSLNNKHPVVLIVLFSQFVMMMILVPSSANLHPDFCFPLGAHYVVLEGDSYVNAYL